MNEVNALSSDIKYGIRQLIKTPAFTVVAVLSLALGMGANTTIFSMVNAVMLRSLPVHKPHELRVFNWVESAGPGKINAWVRQNFITRLPNGDWSSDAFSYENYCKFRDNASSDTVVMAMRRLWRTPIQVQDRPGHREGLLVSGNCFRSAVSFYSGRPFIMRFPQSHKIRYDLSWKTAGVGVCATVR